MATPWDGMAAANLKRKGIYEPALAAAATLLAYGAQGGFGQAAAKAPRSLGNGGWTGTMTGPGKKRKYKTAKKYKRSAYRKKPTASKVVKKKMKKTTVYGNKGLGQKGDTKQVTIYTTSEGHMASTHMKPLYEMDQVASQHLRPLRPIINSNYPWYDMPPTAASPPQTYDNRIKYWSSGDGSEAKLPQVSVTPSFTGTYPDLVRVQDDDSPGYDALARIKMRTVGVKIKAHSLDMIGKDDLVSMIQTHTHARVISCGAKYVSKPHGLKNSVITHDRMAQPTSYAYLVPDVDGNAMELFQGPQRTVALPMQGYTAGEVDQEGLELLKHGGYCVDKKTFSKGNTGWLTWQPKTTRLELRDRNFLEGNLAEADFANPGGIKNFYDQVFNYVPGGLQQPTRWSDQGTQGAFQTSGAILFISWASTDDVSSELRCKTTVQLSGKRYEPLSKAQAEAIYATCFVDPTERLSGVTHDNSDRTGREYQVELMFGSDGRHPLCMGATPKPHSDGTMDDAVFQKGFVKNFTGAELGDDEQDVLDDM